MSEAREKARTLLAYATPGPWLCQPYEPMRSDVYAVGCPQSTMIAKVFRMPVSVMTNARRARPEYDAALIAAAPALLAALCDEGDALERRAEDVEALRTELAQEAALRGELAAEVKRLKAFETAELQRRAIFDAMNGGEA